MAISASIRISITEPSTGKKKLIWKKYEAVGYEEKHMLPGEFRELALIRTFTHLDTNFYNWR
jgi:hypothetical protein